VEVEVAAVSRAGAVVAAGEAQASAGRSDRGLKSMVETIPVKKARRKLPIARLGVTNLPFSHRRGRMAGQIT
jgi:hypothetical protein